MITVTNLSTRFFDHNAVVSFLHLDSPLFATIVPVLNQPTPTPLNALKYGLQKVRMGLGRNSIALQLRPSGPTLSNPQAQSGSEPK